jgi:hypothetical protein
MLLPAGVPVIPGWVAVPIDPAPSVTAGTKYWVVLDTSANSATNHWNWRKDASDGYAGHTGKTAGSWSAGGPWTDAGGDLAFQTWVGGTNRKITNVEVGTAGSGDAHANLLENVTVRGSGCPNPYCIVDNLPHADLPILAATIAGWKSDAVAGGVCGPPQCDGSGDFILTNGASGTIGPKKINGNLTLSNGATLIVAGTLWVAGDINLSNNCNVHLASSYGASSGVIVTDGTVTISNNCAFQGSGDPTSFILLLSDRDSVDEEIIVVDNNSVGVIYYSARGRIKFSNNAQAKEATAYGITLDNGATITYDSGLANLNFSSGPGGGFAIDEWREVE